MFFLASITSCRYLLLSNMYGGLCLSYLLWSKVNDITLIFNLKNLHTIQTTHCWFDISILPWQYFMKDSCGIVHVKFSDVWKTEQSTLFLSLVLKLIFFSCSFLCQSLNWYLYLSPGLLSCIYPDRDDWKYVDDFHSHLWGNTTTCSTSPGTRF